MKKMEEQQQQQQLKNVRMMWHLDYYDGPRSGVLFYKDEIHYFDMTEQHSPELEDPKDEDSDIDWKWYRKYAVYALSDDDKIRLVATHALWQAHVGVHSDYWPLNGRDMHSRKRSEKTCEVPALHYGPRVDRTFDYEEHQGLKKLWDAKYGMFTTKEKEPIGWIYYEQLFGKDDLVENQE